MKPCVYQQISKQERQSSEKWNALTCKKCGMHMTAVKRPTGIKFVCSGIYCYHSVFEADK